MNNRNIILIAFVLVALGQLFVPVNMIFNREKIIYGGNEYKFLTAPIDPTDPFRGKYITLNFKENAVNVTNEYTWKRGETVYVLLENDAEGYAKIGSVSKFKPVDNENYLKANVANVINNKLSVKYPFNRYYMEESKAYGAERTYRESSRDTTKITYALVNIKDGEAVLKDVLINGVPISELVAK